MRRTAIAYDGTLYKLVGEHIDLDNRKLDNRKLNNRKLKNRLMESRLIRKQGSIGEFANRSNWTTG
jgi:hypothetical protein